MEILHYLLHISMCVAFALWKNNAKQLYLIEANMEILVRFVIVGNFWYDSSSNIVLWELFTIIELKKKHHSNFNYKQ